jgi:fibro-slime domain-containing protein
MGTHNTTPEKKEKVMSLKHIAVLGLGVVVGLVCLGMSVSPAWADTMTVTLTIRDFMNNHPDFARNIFLDDPNIVGSTLGLDGKPVYVGDPLNGTATTHAGNGFTAKQNFDQWYNDVLGINMTTTKDIVLTKQADGYFHYDNASFFPIDNELFGNEGLAHNYSFTAEYHGQFVYQTGQQFTFASDDDSFVFINDQLVLNLGGVHQAENHTVNLDTLGLTAGQEYPFDFFYAERNPGGAVMSMWTAQLTPEPTTMVLMGLGLVGTLVARRRSRR